MENFNSIFEPLELQYGVNIEDEDAIDIALIGWKKIGNQNYRLYRFRGEVNPQNGEVLLPCNCDADQLEAVTYDFEDWQYTDNLKLNGDRYSAFAEHYIEGHKHFTDQFYMGGKFVHYDKGDHKIYVHNHHAKFVNILYKGPEVDEDGLPYLTPKEAEALAAYVAMTIKFKEGWQTNNQQTLQMAQLLEQKWLKLCSQAKVRYLNQNDMNEILDAKSSWNRHLFGKSQKPIR